MGHGVAVARDTPGFLVNHAGRGYGTEALRIVGEGIASTADVDRILTGAAGFRMGPFELMDLIGIDVSRAVMESLYDQFYQEPRFRPTTLPRQLVSANLLGRKTGRGFYAYEGGKPVLPPDPAPPDTRPLPIWIGRRNPEGAALLAEALAGADARRRRAALGGLGLHRRAAGRGLHHRGTGRSPRSRPHGRGGYAVRAVRPAHADDQPGHRPDRP